MTWDGLTQDTPRLDSVRVPGPKEFAALRDQVRITQQACNDLETRIEALETPGSGPVARWTAVVVDEQGLAGSYLLQAGDDGKLFVATQAGGGATNFRVNDALPVGFSFGFVNMKNGDGSIDSNSGLDHFWDENGDALNAYGTTANPGGMFVEVTKVAAHDWQAVAKVGNWAAT